MQKEIEELAKSSQANLDTCIDANLVCPFLALYPNERQWFNPHPRKLIPKLIFGIIISPRKYHHLGAAATGFPAEKVKKIMARIKKGKGIDYFNEELLPLMEYTICQMNVNSQNYPGYSFKVATNYKEFKQYTDSDKIICGILTIEGGNALGNYMCHNTFTKEFAELESIEKKLLEKSFIDNVKKIKSWRDGRYTPFFISFCHHFNNLLAGHSRSLTPGKKWILPGFRDLFNQEPGLDEGFNELGEKILDKLLEQGEKCRRILIDTKHMSIKSRMYYHYLVKERREKGDKIPIIQSHAAINGWSSFCEADKQLENKNIDKNAYFSRWKINMNDEEILDIYDSDGIIGFVFHEGRMPGGKINARTKKLRKRYNKLKKKENKSARQQKKFDETTDKLKPIYNKLIWSNIFHIVRLIHKNRTDENGEPANGWKIISIGSDYDGLVDPFNTYFSVSDLQTLFNDMVDYINNQKEPVYFAENGKEYELTKVWINKLMFGKTIEELVSDICFNNVANFLKKYFTEDYLLK
jgi:hypothetical protein